LKSLAPEATVAQCDELLSSGSVRQEKLGFLESGVVGATFVVTGNAVIAVNCILLHCHSQSKCIYFGSRSYFIDTNQ
jgi:hypothetical protein